MKRRNKQASEANAIRRSRIRPDEVLGYLNCPSAADEGTQQRRIVQLRESHSGGPTVYAALANVYTPPQTFEAFGAEHYSHIGEIIVRENTTVHMQYLSTTDRTLQGTRLTADLDGERGVALVGRALALVNCLRTGQLPGGWIDGVVNPAPVYIDHLGDTVA